MEAKCQAKKLLLEYGLSKVSLDNLVYIIEAQGFEIVEYSQRDQSGAVWQVLESLNLTTYAKSGKAFTYKCGRSKLLFVCEEMSAEEKLYAFAHEEGHIIFGHLCNGTCDSNIIEEEYLANEFAHYLLAPSWWTRLLITLKNHKKAALLLSVITVVLAIALPIAVTVTQSHSYYGEYYVTENGTKYHEKDCMTIKDRSNVRRLTEKDYYSGDYEPCHVCLPD